MSSTEEEPLTERVQEDEWIQTGCFTLRRKKLIMLGSRTLRARRVTREYNVNVKGKQIVKGISEKVLGTIVNNNMTWRNHL